MREAKRKASRARLCSLFLRPPDFPLRHYWPKAWKRPKQRLVIELMNFVGLSVNFGRTLIWNKGYFENHAFEIWVSRLSRSVHSWTYHALVLVEWTNNGQFPVRDAPARVMVVVFNIWDWIFVLMNKTIMIPCRRVLKWDMPAVNHDSYIQHRGMDIRFDEYNYYDSLMASSLPVTHL